MPADCELYYYIGIWENVKKNPRFSGENFRDLPPDAEKRVSFSPEMWYMKGWKSREDPDMTLLGTALFIFSAQLLAYTVKGLIGFGNPLISAPILSLGLDNAVITPGTLLLDCPVNAWITWKNRRSFQWRRILPLLAANFCGVIPGTLLLRFSLPWVIKTVLGVVVVFLGLEMATRSLRPVRPDRKDRLWLRLAVSAFSGVSAGLFGINMFIVAYLQRTAKDYSEFKGSMCFLFLGENLFRLTTYAVTGLLTGEVLFFGLASLPAAALAMVLCGWLGPRLEEGKLQKGAVVLFLIGGVSIIFKSVVFHT